MASFKRLSLILMTSCAGAALSACDGATSVASPGEGVVIVPAPTPAPAPAPSPTPTPTPTPTTGPAAACPTNTGQALTDAGTIGNFRVCRIPALVTNTTLPAAAGVAYELNGRVNVGIDRGTTGTAGQSGNLTIEPGAVIFANTTLTDPDYLIVNRGSTINAQGTAARPIIFTAQENLTGNVTDETEGLWGGIILAGRAPIADCATGNDAGGTSTTCEATVEGTGNALYGGNAQGDSSGVFQYVQIRYSGTVIGGISGNELQGLTLAGAGSGTVIDHVQVHNSSDDGIEIFGGTSNLRHLVITGADDDSLDYDSGWRGFVQFALLIQAQTIAAANDDAYALEIDSNGNNDRLPRTYGRLANFTAIHYGSSAGPGAAIRLRGGADTAFVNGIVVSPKACIQLLADTSDRSTVRPADAGLQDAGPPTFNSMFFQCSPFAIAGTRGSGASAVTITASDAEALLTAGSSANNVAGGTNGVQNGFFPGSGATGVTPTNASTLPGNNGFLVNTSYIGAVSGSGDTWFQGWTCNSNRANFGAASGNCTALPST
ncbi:hypothetical protein [Sphingosinithalassobacter sp. LHW66-3]|uniref:hypothetical protein n=1 Tax=Sphingosinithalassobacter sp. LHW66-3 TaxID=3424718 RepID=UPI003D6AC251